MPKKRVIDNSIWKDCFNLFPTNGSKSYVDKLDFFQHKTNYTYDNVDDTPIQSYEYIARKK